jgi:hypothetical protein
MSDAVAETVRVVPVTCLRRVGVGAIGVAVALSCGCAVTTTCPTGTKLTVAQKPEGRAQWCAVTDTTVAELPVVGRSYQGTLGLGHPAAMPGGVDGPFTSWYPNGAVESHGRYVSYGARSVPEGLWAFWHPNGQRWVIGNYHRGEPVGCFAEWDENGKRSTGTVQGDQLHVEPCTPPPDDELAVIEGRARPHDESPAWGDVSLQGFAGPNHLGATNGEQISPNPGMTLAFSATARKWIGRLRVGPTVGVRVGDNSDGMGLVAGGTVGWELPSFHPRIDAEVSAELAVQRISVTAARSMQPGTASLSFWSPLPAVQAGVAFALSPDLAAVATVRVDGVPARSVDRDVVYCDFFSCYAPVHETWQIGTFAYGVNLGLRLVLR